MMIARFDIASVTFLEGFQIASFHCVYRVARLIHIALTAWLYLRINELQAHCMGLPGLAHRQCSIVWQ